MDHRTMIVLRNMNWNKATLDLPVLVKVDFEQLCFRESKDLCTHAVTNYWFKLLLLKG